MKKKPIIILDRVVKPLKPVPKEIGIRETIKNVAIFFDTLDYWLERHNSLDNGKN